MHSRIQDWYDGVQEQERSSWQGRFPNAESSRFELPFQRALLLLYRPSTMIPAPSQQARAHLASAACRAITLYKQFYTEHRINLFWQAAANIFDAGTALMDSYAESSPVRESLDLSDLDSLTHLCSNLLWALVERSPAFRHKRDEFDRIREQTLSGFRNQGRVGSHVNDRVYHSQQEQFQTTGAHEYDVGNDVGLTTVGEVASNPMVSAISDLASPPWSMSAAEQAFDWNNVEDGVQLDTFSWDWE